MRRGWGRASTCSGRRSRRANPYVTPKPDDRLACVRCPPLAAAVDAKSATLALAGQPKLPPYAPRSDAFPGFYLRIGDEIVPYRDLEWGPPPRFVRVPAQPAGHEGRTIRPAAQSRGY